MRSSLIRRLVFALAVFAFSLAPGLQPSAMASSMAAPSSHCVHAGGGCPDKSPTDQHAKLLCCATVCASPSIAVPLHASLVIPRARLVFAAGAPQASLTSFNIAPDPFP